MPHELDDAVVVEFPLRGERWVAVNSTGDRIPSHGTDMLGRRFAFDFLKVAPLRAARTLRWTGTLRLCQTIWRCQTKNPASHSSERSMRTRPSNSS